MDLTNKVIIITGASSGIGYAVANELLKRECKIVLLARRQDLLNELLYNIPPNKAISFHCDVTDKDEVYKIFQEIKKKFGLIDIAILNAGFGERVDVEDFNSDSVKKTFEVNLFGLTNCIEVLLPDFIKRNNGIIAGVTSLADSKGYARSGAYSASKAAASILLESLRIELKQYNIKVLTIKPGFVRTAMTAKNEFTMPFLMEPAEAACAIIKGIEKEKRIIRFPFLLTLLVDLIKYMPLSLYDYLSYKQLLSVKKNN